MDKWNHYFTKILESWIMWTLPFTKTTWKSLEQCAPRRFDSNWLLVYLKLWKHFKKGTGQNFISMEMSIVCTNANHFHHFYNYIIIIINIVCKYILVVQYFMTCFWDQINFWILCSGVGNSHRLRTNSIHYFEDKKTECKHQN